MTLQVRKLVLHAFIYFIAAAAIVAVVPFIITKPSLDILVDAFKGASLAVLIVVNGTIAAGIERTRKDLVRLNVAILGLSLFLLVIAASGVLQVDLGSQQSINPAFRTTLHWLETNIVYLATLPIFLYAVLDAYIAYVRKQSNAKDRGVAKYYLMFVDTPCIMPLLPILVLAALNPTHTAESNARLFAGGAVTMVLFSSAIAAKAVDMFVDASDIRGDQGW
jgi:hypothetical protein